MSVADALRMMNAGLDYLNGPGAGELDAAACGSVLRSLAEVQAKFTAVHASVLARFDAADAHDSDGYGTSATWLMAMTDMTRGDARAEVWQMRLLRDHPEMAAALADADIFKSQALAIAEWTRKLPAELRAETIKILVQAAQAGASRTAMLTVVTAHNRCSSSRDCTSHTHRVRPLCSGTAVAFRWPSSSGRRKFVSLDIPITTFPSGYMASHVPRDASASARAEMTPPCNRPNCWRSSSRISTRPRTAPSSVPSSRTSRP